LRRSIIQQHKILERLMKVVPLDGTVEIHLVSGSLAAANIIANQNIDLIILDHDMAYGSGSDLLLWLKNRKENDSKLKEIQIITASGIPANNEHMISLGAHHKFNKQEIIDGLADEIIKSQIKS